MGRKIVAGVATLVTAVALFVGFAAPKASGSDDLRLPQMFSTGGVG